MKLFRSIIDIGRAAYITVEAVDTGEFSPLEDIATYVS